MAGLFTQKERQLIHDHLMEYCKYDRSMYEKVIKHFKGRYTGPKGLCKWLGERDIKFFGKYYLPDIFANEFGNHHEAMFKTIEEVAAPECLINFILFIMFRGASKSTVGNTLLALHRLLYKKNFFIFEISASQTLANGSIETIKEILEDNEGLYGNLTEDFGDQVGDKWSAAELKLTNGNRILGRGINSSFRGLNKKASRPDLIICDDLETDEAMGTAEIRNKVKKKFYKAVLPLGKDKGKTKIIYLGTILHEDSLANELLKSKNILMKKLKCNIILSHPDREDLWEQFDNIITAKGVLPDAIEASEVRAQKAFEFFNENKQEMMRGVSVAWEDRYPYIELRKEMLAMGKAKFYQEKMNDPMADDAQVFKELTYYDKDKTQAKLDMSQLIKVLYVDWSDNKGTGDYAAVIVLGKHKKSGIEYQLYADATKRRIADLNDFVYDIANNKFPDLDLIGYETNGVRTGFTEFVKLFDSPNTLISKRKIIPIHNTGDKHLRILDKQGKIDRGFIQFSVNYPEFNEMVLKYSRSAAHDDPPDALSGADELFSKVPAQIRISRG